MSRKFFSTLTAFCLIIFLAAACTLTPKPTTLPAPSSTENPAAAASPLETENSTATEETLVTESTAAANEPSAAAAAPDPLNNLLEMRSVKIHLAGLRPDGTSRSIEVEIDAAGNMHLQYTLPAINPADLPEDTNLSTDPTRYEIYVIDGNAYAPSDSDPSWTTNPVDTQYADVLSSQMHGLEGFTTWLDMLPAGSLQAAGSEEVGGFATDKYTVTGTVDSQTISGSLWYDPATHSLVKAELHVPAALNSDPEKPERGEYLITLTTEKAEVTAVALPAN